MRATEKLINLAQIIAAIGLGVSYFLPLYETYGILGKINYADSEWILFFWPLPLFVIIYIVPDGWLKMGVCVFSCVGALIALGMIRFLAYFKSAPLIGFFVAQTSIAILIVCWLILSVMTFRIARLHKAETSAQTLP